MSTKEEKSSDMETVVPKRKKLPYQPPNLVEYGDIAKLTQGAMSPSVPDMMGAGGMGGMMA